MRESITAVRRIPEQMKAATITTIVALVVALFAFAMASMALIGGARRAH